MQTMKVVEPNGSTGSREIDYVERYDDSGNRLIMPRSVPMLKDGEELRWGEDGQCYIMKAWPGSSTHDYVYTQ